MATSNDTLTRERGCDPLGNGTFRMVPSGDIVDSEERNRRLSHSNANRPFNDCLGLSWNEIEAMQGGRLVRDA